MIDFLVDMIWSFIKIFIRVPLNFIKRNLKACLTAYFLGVGPLAYFSTAATTHLKITDPINVVNEISQTVKSNPISGLGNIATGGLAYPTLNVGKYITGFSFDKIGNLIKDEDLKIKSNNLKQEASAWFNLGKDNIVNVTEISSTQNNKKSTNFSYVQYPDYYRVIGLANVKPSDFPKKGTFIYSKIDNLGRTRTAKATIDYLAYEKSLNVRQNFKSGDNPSGWLENNPKVSIPGRNGKSYNGYMYNRSHLIGDSIGGRAIKANAITGTRPQNVGNVNQKGGMRYLEIKVQDYFKNKSNNVVYYQVEPIYKGNELIPRSVIVTAMSSDKKINEKVEVYNYANGWSINYNNGSIQPSK